MNLVGKWEKEFKEKVGKGFKGKEKVGKGFEEKVGKEASKRRWGKGSKGKWKREKDSKRKVRSRKKLEMGRWKSGTLGTLGGENESRNWKE